MAQVPPAPPSEILGAPLASAPEATTITGTSAKPGLADPSRPMVRGDHGTGPLKPGPLTFTVLRGGELYTAAGNLEVAGDQRVRIGSVDGENDVVLPVGAPDKFGLIAAADDGVFLYRLGLGRVQLSDGDSITIGEDIEVIVRASVAGRDIEIEQPTFIHDEGGEHPAEEDEDAAHAAAPGFITGTLAPRPDHPRLAVLREDLRHLSNYTAPTLDQLDAASEVQLHAHEIDRKVATIARTMLEISVILEDSARPLADRLDNIFRVNASTTAAQADRILVPREEIVAELARVVDAALAADGGTCRECGGANIKHALRRVKVDLQRLHEAEPGDSMTIAAGAQSITLRGKDLQDRADLMRATLGNLQPDPQGDDFLELAKVVSGLLSAEPAKDIEVFPPGKPGGEGAIEMAVRLLELADKRGAFDAGAAQQILKDETAKSRLEAIADILASHEGGGFDADTVAQIHDTMADHDGVKRARQARMERDNMIEGRCRRAERRNLAARLQAAYEVVPEKLACLIADLEQDEPWHVEMDRCYRVYANAFRRGLNPAIEMKIEPITTAEHAAAMFGLLHGSKGEHLPWSMLEVRSWIRRALQEKP